MVGVTQHLEGRGMVWGTQNSGEDGRRGAEDPEGRGWGGNLGL